MNDLAPGKPAVIDGTVLGWPLKSVNDLPAGDYQVQAILNRYETYHRADGHTLELPPEKGEGQHWYSKPGNFYSTPQRVHLDPAAGQTVDLSLNKVIPPIPEPKDTKWVKFVRIKSDLLSKFWGRPMYLGAFVLLPAGFDDHPTAHYPLAVDQGHFPDRGFPNFSPQPPAPGMSARDSTRTAYGYDLFKKWTGPHFPRMLVISIQHANQFYDDSYAVNSANVGPYGDAIVHELIPYVEKRFRGIGAGWARTQFGGSTGGWESLGEQIFYPDDFNGTWTFCPDPVDFRQYETIDIYHDTSAFVFNNQWKQTPQPSGRDHLGHLLTTVEDDNHWEYVQGQKDRSSEQWDILADGVRTRGQRWIPGAFVRQAHRPHQSEGRRILEGALRSSVHPAARLEDPWAKAGGKDSHLQRHDGQLAPEQCGLSDAGLSRLDHRPLLCGIDRVRRPLRALLDWRLPALAAGWGDDGVSALHADHGAAHRPDRARRGGHGELAVLRANVSREMIRRAGARCPIGVPVACVMPETGSDNARAGSPTSVFANIAGMWRLSRVGCDDDCRMAGRRRDHGGARSGS